MLGDVGGGAERGLVPRDQHAVPCRHEVGLDVVGPQGDPEPVGLQRVLRPVRAGAAVGDDERRLAVEGCEVSHGPVLLGRRAGRDGRARPGPPAGDARPVAAGAPRLTKPARLRARDGTVTEG
jgi:hypothetical protein